MNRRILFLAMNLNSGGAERQMVTIASALKNKGYNVSFVCYEEGCFFLDQLEGAGIHVDWLIKKGVLERYFAFRKYIRKGQYDVVISFLETPNILNCLAALGPHKWKVITGERSAKEERIRSMRGRIVANLQRRSDALVCNSFNAARILGEYYPFLKKKLSTIYNIVKVNLPIGESPKYDNSRVRIVIAASYQFLKNPLIVVKAVSLLSTLEKNNLRIDWFGNINAVPSAFAQMKDLIVALKLQDVVFLHEETRKIHSEMMNADFVGLFSSVEGLPNSICEAMQLGKPIICSRVSDYSVLVQGNGFLCDGNCPSSICLAMKNAMNSSLEDRKKMGKRSLELSYSLFSEEKLIGDWNKIIEQ